MNLWIYVVDGKDTMNDQTYQKWFVKFHPKYFLLNNSPEK